MTEQLQIPLAEGWGKENLSPEDSRADEQMRTYIGDGIGSGDESDAMPERMQDCAEELFENCGRTNQVEIQHRIAIAQESGSIVSGFYVSIGSFGSDFDVITSHSAKSPERAKEYAKKSWNMRQATKTKKLEKMKELAEELGYRIEKEHE